MANAAVKKLETTTSEIERPLEPYEVDVEMIYEPNLYGMRAQKSIKVGSIFPAIEDRGHVKRIVCDTRSGAHRIVVEVADKLSGVPGKTALRTVVLWPGGLISVMGVS